MNIINVNRDRTNDCNRRPTILTSGCSPSCKVNRYALPMLVGKKLDHDSPGTCLVNWRLIVIAATNDINTAKKRNH